MSRVENLAGWYGEFVLTGMNAGRRSVWRFTLDPDRGRQRDETLRSESPPEFRIGPTTVTFPDGEIHQPEPALSQLGYWILAPLDARPKITTDWEPFVNKSDRNDALQFLERFDLDDDGAIDRNEFGRIRNPWTSLFWLMGDSDGDRRLLPGELVRSRAMWRYDQERLKMGSSTAKPPPAPDEAEKPRKRTISLPPPPTRD